MAWYLLFGSDIGLLSLFTIVFIICMVIYLWRYAKRNMIADEERAKQG